jgi:hypothetical protein
MYPGWLSTHVHSNHPFAALVVNGMETGNLPQLKWISRSMDG